ELLFELALEVIKEIVPPHAATVTSNGISGAGYPQPEVGA
ncbi:MAG: hypothetical protein QOD27_404, partial [Microbacteriaceae bacterium]|nr:hypothetical protein [Microbacteriaceae bacterium]